MTPEEREVAKSDPPAPYRSYSEGGIEESTQAQPKDGGETGGENGAVKT